MARHYLSNSLLAILRLDIHQCRFSLLSPIHEPEPESPRRNAGLGSADIPVHAVWDHRERGRAISEVAGREDDDAGGRTDGAGVGDVGFDTHVYDLLSQDDSVRVAVAGLEAGDVYLGGPTFVYYVDDYWAGEGVSHECGLFW